MKIIIAGAGKVGATLTRELRSYGHDITLIEMKPEVLADTCEHYDVMGITGNCATLPVLNSAGIEDAELLIAVTDADERNLLCCLTAHAVNPSLHTIARIRDPEYSKQIYDMREIFGLSMTVNPERQAAEEISKQLKYPGFVKRESFARGRVEIVELQLGADSPLIGTALKDFPRLAGCRALICAVLRGGETHLPRGGFVLQQGDRIFVTAPSVSMPGLLQRLGVRSRRVKSVLLCGGGRIAYYLTDFLERSGIRVTIVERNPEFCEELSRLLPHTAIVQGDASQTELLEKEGLTDCDALVTLTGMDETNVLLSLFGASRQVPKIITKLGHMEPTEPILENLGLGSLISPKELVSRSILRFVHSLKGQDPETAVTEQELAEGRVLASEFQITPDSPGLDTPLRELKLEPGILFAAVCRGMEAEIAGGDSCYRAGDTVIVLSLLDRPLRYFREIFL